MMEENRTQNILFIILLPFSMAYGLIIYIRNYLYKIGWLQSVRFSIPVISVGNLSVGGSGKTPLVEYLIHLLLPQYKIAKLSRGYGRKKNGFAFVDNNTIVTEVGDEPLMLKRKFPDAIIAVSENRMLAIPDIIANYEETQLIILDDAFQHRSVKAGLNILLTEYNHPFTNDFILPAGRLREPRSSYKRADIILITKCPPNLSVSDREKLRQKIKPLTYQHLYFSFLKYRTAYRVFGNAALLHASKNHQVILLSGIARSDYLEAYVRDNFTLIAHYAYSDHHWFDQYELDTLLRAYQNVASLNPVIITTEKDAARLSIHADFFILNKIPIYCLPVEIDLFERDKAAFEKDIFAYMNYSINQMHNEDE